MGGGVRPVIMPRIFLILLAVNQQRLERQMNVRVSKYLYVQYITLFVHTYGITGTYSARRFTGKARPIICKKIDISSLDWGLLNICVQN